MSTPTSVNKPVRVVLVDDSADIRCLVRSALRDDIDFDVVGEAENGHAGVHAVAEHDPDLVLLDLAMPVMDGLQALPLIREQSAQVRVVMLSAFPAHKTADRALALGADAYIVKGSMRELLTKLRDLYDLNEAKN